MDKVNIPSTEINMSLFTILLSATMSLFLFFVALNLFDGHFYFDFKRLVLHIYTDMISVINPFGLILLSRSVRDSVSDFLSFKWKNGRLSSAIKKVLVLIAALYFCFIFLTVLALVDVYVSCHALDLGYRGEFCQRMMGCTNEGLRI